MENVFTDAYFMKKALQEAEMAFFPRSHFWRLHNLQTFWSFGC